MSSEGKIEVSPQAVAIVVAEAVSECYGVVGMAPITWWESLLTALRRPPRTKGIHVGLDDGTVVVDVHVVIEYGTRIATVASNVTSAVRFRLEQALGTSALRVNVFVENVRVGPHSS
ncbi:MAG: Asp23/Gls24 family envelope stress response protein [Anaerolineae bacterium]